MAGPYFLLCAYLPCGSVKQVRKPSELVKHRFCSRRCARLATPLNIPRAANLQGVQRSVQVRRQKVLAKVAGLSPLEAFRTGYKIGLESKLRQIRRKYQLVPIAAAPQEEAR